MSSLQRMSNLTKSTSIPDKLMAMQKLKQMMKTMLAVKMKVKTTIKNKKKTM